REVRRTIGENGNVEGNALRRKSRAAAQTIYPYGPETVLPAGLEGTQENPGSRGLFNQSFPGAAIEFLLNDVMVGFGIGLAQEADLAAVSLLNGQTAFAWRRQYGLLALEKHEATDRRRAGECRTGVHQNVGTQAYFLVPFG